MKIHEFQAKQVLRDYGVTVPDGGVARTPDEAETIASGLGGKVVVKAQIHAGGRGKGGGVKLATSSEEARQLADDILGMQLVTHQTGPAGQAVKQVLVEKASDIARELYLGITLDRARGCDVIMASQEGGVEIEQVAATNPEAILREHVHPGLGLRPFQATRLAFGLGLEGKAVREGAKMLLALYEAYQGSDCSLAEINPLVITGDGQVLALDAKINLDDNALFRHKDLAALRDLDEEAALEVEASEHGLNYIKLDGNIGCMVNGAGLAMATMDIIKLAGGEPANFLDVGGGASAETVENGFRILLSDPNVKAILINIFGGIVRCDRVAEGVIQARKNIEVNVPVVVRLAGTNADVAAEMLQNSEMDFTVGEGLKDAAQKAVEVLR
ncbi:MAG: ADP-forming succinate--CoA ligase subunit beta [Candidatus Latescibacteria bacterium]|jgi:succinyl-CoA synthetase beta subunit|nr:ADP-forming succinate--CoA ligase subunit beta [Candidatus Latescibacterota bacterium]HJP33788.1 ADP-forming succinate--CoA ligase subunit beta [Candidatus Latescibacterota bacterium]